MHYALRAISLVVIYLAAAKIGLVFGTVNGGATIFWPPSGIALAALLLGGPRYSPAIFLAAYLAGAMLGTPWLFNLGAALGNTLEPLLGMYLLRRYMPFDPALQKISDLYALLFFGGMLAACVSALLGPLALLGTDLISRAQLPAIMWRWWRADVLGVAFLTPLLLIYRQPEAFLRAEAGLKEVLLLWLISIQVGNHLFLDCCDWLLPAELPQRLAWVFPLLIWAGFRTSKKNLALLQLLFIGQALFGAYWKSGLFADAIANYALANFWLFAVLMAVSGMSLAILVDQQRRATAQLALHAKVFSVTNDGVLITDSHNKIIAINPAFTHLTGYTLAEVQGRDPRILSAGEQNGPFYTALWAALQTQGHWEGELWNRHKRGYQYLEKLAIFVLRDSKQQIVNHIAIFSDITSQKARQEHIEHLAQHDFLTNLPNRFLLLEHIKQQIHLANRGHSTFSLIYLDLNHFKPVNDTLGHQVGDQLLIAVAGRLLALVRKSDTVARLGGDEFAILLSGMNDPQDVQLLATKIEQDICHPFQRDQHHLNISTSVGIAIYPQDGVSMDELLIAADRHMYQHKQAQR